MMPDRVGQQLGSYQLTRLVGRGGFADVYLGTHMRLNIQAAIKILHTHLPAEDIEHFQHEAQTVAGLVHPHIIRVFDFDVQQGMAFLVMDYAPNGSLRQQHPRGQKVPLTMVVSYVKQVADALQYAHDRRLIHRDIKPENMLLGAQHEVLLSDFGIATIAHNTASLSMQAAVGTLPYMAPEQMQEHPRPASDQYSLAIVAYEWLGGERPFQGSMTEIMAKQMMAPPPPLREKRPDLAPGVEQVIFTALAKDPKQRFATVKAFANALEQASQTFQQGPIMSTPRPTPIPPATPDYPYAHTPPTPNYPAAPSSPQHATPPWLASPQYPIVPAPAQHITPDRPFQPEAVQQQNMGQHHNTEIAPPPPQTVPTPPLYTPPTYDPARNASSTTVPQQPMQPAPPATHTPPRGKIALIVALVCIVLIGSIGTLYTVVSTNNAHMQATATANAQIATGTSNAIGATATVRVAPTATANAAATAYATSVSANGIMFGFAAQHLHENPYEKILNTKNVANLVPAWTYNTGGKIHDSSPVVVDGIAYIGSLAKSVYAINIKDGTQLWSYNIGNTINSSPAVANGIVYIGSDDGSLYALDAKTGSKLWSFATGTTIYTASPTIVDGVVYIGSWDKNLYALDAKSGSKLWEYNTQGVFDGTPAVVNGVVYVGNAKDVLYALDAKSGSKIWEYDGPADYIDDSPTVVDDVVYYGTLDGSFNALNAKNGSKLWSINPGAVYISSPAVVNGVIYIGSENKTFYALDAKTGATDWSYITGSAVHSSPLVANGVVYVGSDDKTLYAFDAQTGNKLWSKQLGDAVTSSPFVLDGVVYVGCEDNLLYAFHLPQ